MVDELLNEAYQLFEEAEMKIDSGSQSIILFRKAVMNLLNAYLITQGIQYTGELAEVYRQCINIDPEFELIHCEVDYLINVVYEEVDGEELTDYANEIWDFIQSMLMEPKTENL